MKNILLQHWAGEMDELTELSVANISKYAEQCGAEYKLLEGKLFNQKLSPQCQKLFMLDSTFDEYDMVVMVDADMFTRKGMTANIFTDVEGIGRHTPFQTNRQRALNRSFPDLANMKYPFWGGAIYRLDLEIRQRLREHFNIKEMSRFSNSAFHDEGIMHRLATLANFQPKVPYIKGPYWDHGSYESDVHKAEIIHVRTKVTPKGPSRPKMENYKDLVNRGIIEG
jgi:hypothetical protein